jgi:hypothetical protein
MLQVRGVIYKPVTPMGVSPIDKNVKKQYTST